MSKEKKIGGEGAFGGVGILGGTWGTKTIICLYHKSLKWTPLSYGFPFNLYVFVLVLCHKIKLLDLQLHPEQDEMQRGS